MSQPGSDDGRAEPSAEKARLAEADSGELSVARVGALPLRAGLGHGPGGLQRPRHAPGTTSRTTTPAPGRTAGTRTASAGICDDRQTFCFALALWNGKDPILKERIFGLTGPEGNHGEDAKEYWWYLDSTPTHSWMTLALPLPAGRLPLRRAGARQPPARARRAGVRAASTPASSTRTGTGSVTVDYAKASPDRRLHQDHRRQPRAGGGHACTCCPRCGSATPGRGGCPAGTDVPTIHGYDAGTLVAKHRILGRLVLAGEGEPEALCCDNETNAERLCGAGEPLAVPQGRHQRLPDQRCSARSTPTASAPRRPCTTRWTCAPGETRELRLRLALVAGSADEWSPEAAKRDHATLDLAGGFDAVMADPASRGRRVLRRADPARAPAPTRRWCCARPWPG